MIKSINDNYKDLSDDQFLRPEQLTSFQLGMEWQEFGLNLVICRLVWSKEIGDHLQKFWMSIPESRSGVVVVAGDHNWEDIYLSLVDQMEQPKEWLYLYHRDHGILNPYADLEISLLQRISGNVHAKRKRRFRKVDAIETIVDHLLGNGKSEQNQEILLQQGRIKPQELDNWISRLQKAKIWNEDEQIIDIASGRLRRNHYSVNSNFNRSGKLILTNKRLIFARRSFSIFGLGLAALVPVIAFVRPANKLIAAARYGSEVLKLPFTVAKPLFRSFWPAIGALVVSINFLNFSGIRRAITGFFSRISLEFLIPSLDFVIDQPQVALPAIGGIYTGLRLGILKFFFRKYRLVYLPLDQLNFVLLDGREIIGRWNVRGHQLVRADQGIQYRLMLRSHNKDLSSATISARFFMELLQAANHAEPILTDGDPNS